MKKLVYALLFSLVVVSGLLFAHPKFKKESSKNLDPKPLSAAEMKTGRERWEATADGMMFKKWEASPAGNQVYAAEGKIRKHLTAFTSMEGVVTSLSLPPGSRLGFGVMVRIDDEDYILSFGVLQDKEFQQLQSLRVNDRIIIRSRNVSHAPKYAYPILAGDYIERDSKIIYKRAPRKGSC